MDAAEALDRAAKALTTAEDNATVNPDGAVALVAVADGWGRLARIVDEGPERAVARVRVLARRLLASDEKEARADGSLIMQALDG